MVKLTHSLGLHNAVPKHLMLAVLSKLPITVDILHVLIKLWSVLHLVHRLNSPIAARSVWGNDLFLTERLLNSASIAYKVLWCNVISI